LHYKVWLSDEKGENLLGDDRWQLLKGIEQHGSLKAAAGKLGISYRKAWGDIKFAEQKLGFQLVHKTRGGRDGGNSMLTEEGKRFILAYDEFHREFASSVDEVIIKFKRTLKKKE
jgi:molybdate transport repressor ModE-like protein